MKERKASRVTQVFGLSKAEDGRTVSWIEKQCGKWVWGWPRAPFWMSRV